MSGLASQDGSDGIVSGSSNGDAPVDDVAASALATVREVTAEIVRLVRTAATHATDGWSIVPLVRSLVPELERVVEERTALGREARTLRVRVAELDERVHELEALVAAREAGWKAERAAFEDDVVRERDHAEMLAQELEQRRAEIASLQGRARRAREQMESAAARANTDREKTLRLAREMVRSAEEARFAVVAEMETLRSTLAAEQARLDETQHERARATQGAAELEAELAHARQIVEQLEASRAGAAAELSRSRASLVHTESELLAVQHEYQLSQVQLERLCAAQDDMVEDQAQLVAKLHDAQEREARLRLRITGLEQRLQAVRDGSTAPIEPPAAAIDAVVEAATARLTTELSDAAECMHALRDELSRAKATASAATVRTETLQAEVHATEQARAAAVAELESLRSAVTVVASDAAVVPEPSGEADSKAEAPELTAVEPVEPLALVEQGAQAEEEPPAESDPPLGETDALVVTGTIAVLDTSGAWDGVGGGAVRCFTPAPDLAERLRDLAPACCLVNLGTAGTLDAAVALRAADLMVPLWGFATAANGAVALGRIDVVPRPVDPGRVRARVELLAPRGGNAIMIGSEGATRIPLRQGLQQGGMSVRTAWNHQQATDIARTVEPDVVTIDLGSVAPGAAELMADLVRRPRPPAIVIVLGAPEHGEELASSLAARAMQEQGIERRDLVRAAVDAVGRSER